MYASVRSWVERVRLWVDNVILIDQWTSLEGTENSGTIYMGTAGGYYDVVMEYKQPNGTGGDQGVSFQSSLAEYYYGVLSFNVSLYFRPNNLNVSNSLVTGDSFSIITAGIVSSFQVVGVDEFQNNISCQDYFVQIEIPASISTNQSFLCLLDDQGILSFSVNDVGNIEYQLFLNLNGTFLEYGIFVSASAVSLSNSLMTGNGFSLATAGIPSSIFISLRDQFGSIINNSGLNILMIDNNNNLIVGYSRNLASNLSVLSYSVNSTLASLSMYQYNGSGLTLSILEDGRYQDLYASSPQERSVQISWPDLIANFQIPTTVRWQGIVSLFESGQIYFRFQLKYPSDRVQLWIDNSLVIDQWSSLSSLLPLGSISVIEGQFAITEVFYKNSNSSFYFCQLEWSRSNTSESIDFQLIQTERLGPYPMDKDMMKLDWLQILPNIFQSSVIESFLSIATAGSNALFSVVLFDAYGNSPLQAQNVISYLKLNEQNERTTHAFVTVSNEFKTYYTEIPIPTRTTNITLFIEIPQPGGLEMFAYNDEFGVLLAAIEHASIDFSAAPGTKPFPSLPGDSPYSIRWSGFVRPPVASVYT
eukprot:764427-Hanusia_phi.AAC.1